MKAQVLDEDGKLTGTEHEIPVISGKFTAALAELIILYRNSGYHTKTILVSLTEKEVGDIAGPSLEAYGEHVLQDEGGEGEFQWFRDGTFTYWEPATVAH